MGARPVGTVVRQGAKVDGGGGGSLIVNTFSVQCIKGEYFPLTFERKNDINVGL